MSVDDHILTDDAPAPTPTVPSSPPSGPQRARPRRDARNPRARRRPPPRQQPHQRLQAVLVSWLKNRRTRPRVRVRKLRFLLILSGFCVLAVISTLFGMLTSVASDLPQLENRALFSGSVESYMYDDTGQPIGALAPPNQRVVDQWQQISPSMVHAIVAIEDRRFWSDPGIDLRGIARAFISDVTGGPREGASTIAEQFVKNALAQEDNRTILEKLREAALAFQLVHRWKRTRILTSYLNTIYFGHGAYGIESAARVYFGWAHGFDAANPASEPSGACGDPSTLDPRRQECAQQLQPWEAAMLAGMVANPTAFDPSNPATRAAAFQRRDLVLQDMMAQHYITRAEYEVYRTKPLPTAQDIQQPQEPAAAPYFTSWVRPQIVAALENEGVPKSVAQYRAFYGGLKVRLTINLKMQQAAQQAIDAEFPPGSNGPTASLVAIDNRTGEVRAMVSGDGNYQSTPFNLATMGLRQPGSSFKIFTLAAALTSGKYGPSSIIDSAPQRIPFRLPGGRLSHFVVHNFGNAYSGPISLAAATAVSDNSVFAQVGMHTGVRRIKHFARLMGIRTPISTNPSMILGGLNTGVSALDMAHAYETVATGGLKVFNPKLGDADQGPIGIHSILCPICSQHFIVNSPTRERVLPATVATTIRQMLEGVVGPSGTGAAAAIPGVMVAGKTGTTTNYVDAWFVGWTPQLTTAVWVGYPDKAVPMTTDYNGGPVEGGTFPAVIWRNFMEQALQILASEHPTQTSTVPLTTPVTPAVTSAPSTPAPASPVTPPAPTTPAAPPPPAPAAGGGTAGAGTTGGGTAGGGTGNGGTTGGGTTGGGTNTTGGGGGTGGGTGGGGTGGGGTGGATPGATVNSGG